MTESHREPPRLIVRPHPTDPLGFRADLIGHDGPIEIDFGDGDGRVRLKSPGRQPAQHSYPSPGCYMVSAHTRSGVVARQQVVARGRVDITGVTVSEDDGGIRISFSEPDDLSGVLPYYRVEWHDGEHDYEWGVPGNVVRRDAVPGRHEIRLVDTTSGRAQRFDVEVSEGTRYDPDFVVLVGREDDTGMTIVVRIEQIDHDAPIHVHWDDDSGPQVVESPSRGLEIPHRYRHPGHYMQTVSYAGETSFARNKSEAMTVPHRHAEDHSGDVAGSFAAVASPAPAAPRAPGVSDPVDRDAVGVPGVGRGFQTGAPLVPLPDAYGEHGAGRDVVYPHTPDGYNVPAWGDDGTGRGETNPPPAVRDTEG